MVGTKSVRDPIPDQFATIEEAAEFWDTHDLADYWDLTEEVDFEVNLRRRRYLVAVDPDLAERLAKAAYQQGLSTETLINLWLSEKLRQVSAWNLDVSRESRVAESSLERVLRRGGPAVGAGWLAGQKNR